MKKNQSKVAQNRPPTFFMFWPCCPNDQETEILYHQKPLNAGLGIKIGISPDKRDIYISCIQEKNRHFCLQELYFF